MKKRRQYDETKGEKFVRWIKEKRFYIVLLLCIFSVSATYFSVDYLQKSAMEKPQQQSNIPTPSPQTPLPDLTKEFPKNIDTATGSTAAPKEEPEEIKKTPDNKTSQAKTPAPAATPKVASVGAQADTDYEPTKKATLTYPVNGEIITVHSVDNLIYSKTLGDWRTHNGIDIKSPISTDVRAAGGGIIAEVYTDDFMGITIVIDHQNGIKTLYSNLSNSTLVQAGQTVERGDVISAVGDSAIYETAEVGHLHFEVYENNTPIDPVTILEN